MRLDGHEVWAAWSADEGLGLARTHQPHVIILDLRMPLTNSVRFLRAIRAIPGLLAVPLAIITSDYIQGDVQAAEIAALGAELRYRPLWLNELAPLAHELLALPVKS